MKTKRFLGWVAMATMMLSTSCSSDEVVNDYSPKNAIQFGTYVGRDAESRGHVSSISKLASEGFGVFAYYTAESTFDEKTDAKPNFMYNQQVKSTTSNATEKDLGEGKKGWSGEWTYSPVKYWPNNVNDKVSFFAYAPYDNKSSESNFTLPTSEDKGAPSLTFKVKSEDVELHQDLLYAEPVKDKSKNSSNPVNVTDKITFDFKHALARIGFKAEVMVDEVNDDATGTDDDYTSTLNCNLDDYTTITIKKVQLIGKFYQEGKMALTNGEWSEQTFSTEENGVVTFELKEAENSSASDFATRTEPNYNANIFKKDDIAIRPLNNDKNYIMIIPQNFSSTATDGSNKVKIYVEYEVFTDANKDGKEDANDSKILNKITSDEFEINFQQGNAYSLNLHIGMTSVKFSATVTDWNEVTDKVVNVPINTGTNPTEP